ncbi:MAG: cytochrome c3 family protein [Deltaproteobacteria bacterium]|nr:cytochrome c3 family protein [Deltaproteobacteria bacterium]
MNPLQRFALPAGLLLLLLTLGSPAPAFAAPAKGDSCETCHSDPDFLVRNKKLYDYYRDWALSTHSQEGVTCSDCHGGNPKTKTKEEAHKGTYMDPADPRSPINYRNVPLTCSKCHEDVFKSFQGSPHFKHLKAMDKDVQGPNCVTCHGSVNLTVLNVNTVRAACERCHNTQRKILPEVPDKAEAVLHDLLSVSRYYQFIVSRSEPQEVRAFFNKVDPIVEELTLQWHTFDLKSVQAKTRELLVLLKEKRSELRDQKQRKP